MFDFYASGSDEGLFPAAPAGSATINTGNAVQNVLLEGIRAIESVMIAQKQQTFPSSGAAATAQIAQPVDNRDWVPWAVGLGLIGLVVVLSR